MLQWLTFIVAVMTLGGLIWYVLETRQIRIASQNQLSVAASVFDSVCEKPRSLTRQSSDSPLLASRRAKV